MGETKLDNFSDTKICSEILSNNWKLVFLVGAGCSKEPPTCLPTGYEMMKEIIKLSCLENEISRINLAVTQNDIRFETLIDIFQKSVDKKLKIIDFYTQNTFPNKIHRFLSQMIIQGSIVLTTNFDTLIEQSLTKDIPDNEKIIPVITKDDYLTYSNPKQLFEQKKLPIYKLHGSSVNFVTGEETKDSLIATLEALSQNKDMLNLIGVESFKSKLFENIPSDSILIVMGYSGSDDYDIVPTLKSIDNFSKIIWINHVSSEMIGYELKEIQNLSHLPENANKIDKYYLISNQD